jgi:hypothetical protein
MSGECGERDFRRGVRGMIVKGMGGNIELEGAPKNS